MPPRPLTRLRKLCLSLPEAREVEAWGEPTFRVRTVFAMYASSDSHHGKGRPAVWIKADHANQDLLVGRDPARFFVPPYTGPAGWIGVWLDGPDTDWEQIAELLRDAWRASAPKRLVASFEQQAGAASPARPTRKRNARRARA